MTFSWATTHQSARVAALEEARRGGVEARRRQGVVDSQARRGEAVAAELEQRRAQLDALPDDVMWAALASNAQEGAARAEASLTTLRRDYLDADAAARDARDARLLDAREVQQLEEASVAGRFFGALDPHMCPRCDAAIGEERRRREGASHLCAVCGESVATPDDAEVDLASARERLAASTAAEAAATQRLERTAQALGDAEVGADAARRALASLPNPPELVAARRSLELDIARLEGRVAAGAEAVTDAAAPDPEAAARLRILEAARDEANARRQAEEREMFPQLDERVLALARAFGVRNAESVRLDGAGRLNLQTGGHRSALSGLTPGERVRVKLAVVVALLQLGRDSGVGRHPGVVLVDSPGSHEVSDEDLGSMLAELMAVASSSGMQVIVTTRQLALAASVVSAAQLRLPQDDGTIW